MASDKDQLLAMGFDGARIDCELLAFSLAFMSFFRVYEWCCGRGQ
jgi:hypothetical protein